MPSTFFPSNPVADMLKEFGLGGVTKRPKKAKSGGKGRGGFRGPSSFGHAYNLIMSAVGSQQAVLKMVNNHKVQTATVLRDRLDYLSREMSDDIAAKYDTDNSQKVELEGAVFTGRDYNLDRAEKEELIHDWATSWDRPIKSGHTYHMILSTPKGTDPQVARAIGREFAMRIFESGDFGDKWDYVSALHTDTANPHVHLMINKHGEESGKVLNTFKSAVLNLDYLRQVQVEIAAKYGLHLAATSKLARGITDITPTTAQYRIDLKNGIVPTGRTRTEQSLAFAHMQIKKHAVEYKDLAKSYSRAGDRNIAEILNAAAETLELGKSIAYPGKILSPEQFESVTKARALIKNWYRKNEQTGAPNLPGRAGNLDYEKPDRSTVLPKNYLAALYNSEAKIMEIPIAPLLKRLEERALPNDIVKALATIRKDSFIMAQTSIDPVTIGTQERARAKVIEQINKADWNTSRVKDPVDRINRELDLAKIKANVAKSAPERHDMALFGQDSKFELHSSKALRAMQLSPDQAKMTKAINPVNDMLKKEANKIGLDGDLFVSQYNNIEKIDAGTSVKWIGAEINARLKHHKIDPDKATNTERKAAVMDVDTMHRIAREAYAKAANDVKVTFDVSPTKRTKLNIPNLAKIALDIIDETFDRPTTAHEKSAQQLFIKDVESTIEIKERAGLRAGMTDVLKQVLPVKEDRLLVMKAYFATQHSLATESEKTDLKAKVQKFDYELSMEKAKPDPDQPKPKNKTGPKL